MWPRAAVQFTVYKKGGRLSRTRVPDQNTVIFQVFTDPNPGPEFTVMPRSTSTTIKSGKLVQ
jgi:hypothetical protein